MTTHGALVAVEVADIMRQLEREYGPRNPEYVLKAVFRGRVNQTDLGRGGESGTATNEAIIYLEHTCWHDAVVRAGALAHECVHLLHPVPKREISFLEEAAAEDFSVRYFTQRFPSAAPTRVDPRYAKARGALAELLEYAADAVKLLRQRESSLSRTTELLIRQVVPACPSRTAALLAAKFYVRQR